MDNQLPWRARLKDWPDEWREHWGLRANALEATGLTWVEAERQAWNEILAAKRKQESRTLPVTPTGEETARTLFKDSA